MLEAMLRSDIPSVESCLDLTLDELNVLCQSQQASIKSKATKVHIRYSIVVQLFYMLPLLQYFGVLLFHIMPSW